MTAEALADPSGAQIAPLARGTLGRKLLVRMVVLVASLALLLGTFTTLATRTLLIGQLDTQLTQVMNRQQQFRGGGPGNSDSGRPRPPGGLLVAGQPIGTLAAEFVSGAEPNIGLSSGSSAQITLPDTLYDRLVEQLQSVSPSAGPITVDLAGLGRYRVTAKQSSYGYVVVGLPMHDIDKLLVQLVGVVAVLALLAVGATAVGAREVVVRSLRPLTRLASTAQTVSKLKLDRGDVALAVRVPPEDTDPASEVGRVGLAINHMLNNVAGALEARQASETKVRQFVADASHELRNPLAAIRGYAELTRRSGEDLPPDASYAMARVESEADRMSRLVEDLLLLARLDSGPVIEVRPTDLTDLVINAVSDARVAGPEHVWTLSLPDEPVVALGDRHRLHQVVANLLANARTHTPAATRVECGLAVDGERAVITVTDDGPGIPSEILGQVFERFTRADTSRVRAAGAANGTSTGLGLAIVAAVVEAHQGSVDVASQPGLTSFRVELPLALEDQPV
jgi:two-component system, OmpR family, sensor kinase